MMQLFAKPLKRNDKVGKSPTDTVAIPSERLQNTCQPQSKTPLLNSLMARPDASRSVSTLNVDDSKKPVPTVQIPPRSMRSTRATVLVHDEDDHDQDKEVSKFSVDVGLGKPWPK